MAAARKGATARTPAITQEALIAAGLTVLRREGLDALSMRKVAAELGVQAASLYWHVQDKEELLDLLADSLLWDARKLKTGGDWAENLREMARAYRCHLNANRDSARVMAGRLAPGPNLLYVLDVALGWLRSAGFSDADAAYATRTLATYVQGFVLQEQLPMSSLEAHGASPEEAVAAVAEAFRSAPADKYPNVAALGELIVRDSMDDHFAFGVDQLIEGLRTRLPSAAPAPSTSSAPSAPSAAS
ncbi:TetR/AcrR family transcriptional regulator [Catenulispora subtropica]|uniref:TetR family transcriptional regulator ActII n=1 Tax=Catenulispora subtropica TaxID=450798 RepID=A0ABP5CIM0_9ACTN